MVIHTLDDSEGKLQRLMLAKLILSVAHTRPTKFLGLLMDLAFVRSRTKVNQQWPKKFEDE